MIYKFLWKGPDKVTRSSVINTLEHGGLNLTDIEKQIKTLMLLQPTHFRRKERNMEIALNQFLLRNYGGACNYDVNDLNLAGFYAELFLWWADFRSPFSTRAV